MKFHYIIFLFLFAVILVLLDTSFFSFLALFDASIISSFSFLVFFTLNDKNLNKVLLFASFLAVLFSAFSSLSVLVIMINFIFLPTVMFYLRKNYFSDINQFVVIFILLLINLLFDLVIIFSYQLPWDLNILYQLMSFILINTLFQIFIFSFSWMYKRKIITSEIKL